jgi:flavin-dependent dehydrogenase
MLLARQGRRILVVDRSRYGTDTLSTHALMRGGVLQLHRWGLLSRIRAAGTPTIRRTSFHYGDDVVAIPIKAREGVDGLYAPRRTVIDSLLIDAAVEAGAEVVHGVRVVDLQRDREGRITGVVIDDNRRGRRGISTALVVGADGADSSVARLVGARTYRQGRHASGVIYGYWSGLDLDGYHWYYRPGVSAGAIPTNDGLTCVFVSLDAARLLADHHGDLERRYHGLLAEVAPDLARTVAWAERRGMYHGFAGRQGYLRQSWGPGWTLVGDAGYFKDPITAHGITDALRDAEMLARAIIDGGDSALAHYQTTRDDLSHGLFEVTDDIASYAWDLETLKRWHLDLSEEMSREVAWVQALDTAPAEVPPHVAVA